MCSRPFTFISYLSRQIALKPFGPTEPLFSCTFPLGEISLDKKNFKFNGVLYREQSEINFRQVKPPYHNRFYAVPFPRAFVAAWSVQLLAKH